MAWPTVTIDVTSMDAGTDSPAVARPQIKQMADNVNAIKDAKGAASGIAELDAGGKVPTAQVPTVPANQGGTGQTVFAVGDLLYANSTTTLARLAAGVTGLVLRSNGPGAAPSWQADGAFPSGTRMIFQQTSAPPGWTKETSSAYNDIALRVVTGTVGAGGATAFSSTFTGSKATDGFTLAAAHIPVHRHRNKTLHTATAVTPHGDDRMSLMDANGDTWVDNGENIGGGGTHSHTISNFNLKYSDVIVATKN
jgi:hypothetical protein